LALLAEESERSFGEVGSGFEEDGAVAAVWNDPESGSRYGAIHIDRHFNGIEKVTIPVNNQR
jgi:hypothetical protein